MSCGEGRLQIGCKLVTIFILYCLHAAGTLRTGATGTLRTVWLPSHCFSAYRWEISMAASCLQQIYCRLPPPLSVRSTPLKPILVCVCLGVIGVITCLDCCLTQIHLSSMYMYMYMYVEDSNFVSL